MLLSSIQQPFPLNDGLMATTQPGRMCATVGRES